MARILRRIGLFSSFLILLVHSWAVPAKRKLFLSSQLQWVGQFLESKSPDDLAEPFRSSVNRFLAALNAAGASVSIACTLRPPERAYLMHYCFGMARQKLDPAQEVL